MNKPVINFLESVTQSKYCGGTWTLATTQPLEVVLTPAYWRRPDFKDFALRQHDRVQVTANLNAPSAEYCNLIITEVRNGLVASIMLMGDTGMAAAPVLPEAKPVPRRKLTAPTALRVTA